MPLTTTGLTIPRLPEIKDDLLTNEQQNIDPDISGEDSSVLGQLNAIVAEGISNVYELAEAVHDSFNPLKAEGIQLDDLAALNGLKRIEGTRTSGRVLIVSTPGTLLPEGSVFRNPVTGDRFALVANVTASNENCISVKYAVVSLLNSTNYIISINGNSYQYTSDTDATELEILNGLKTEIDEDSEATWTAVVDTDEPQLIISTSDENPIAVLSTAYIGPEEVTVEGEIEAEEPGPIIAPPNSVTQIVSFVSGLISVTNPEALVLGRDRETDEEFRSRIQESQQVQGRGTVEAIQDQLRDLAGVTSALVVENDTDLVDSNGRPPHSFESVVLGGSNADIALAIWQSKGAGIQTFGNTSELIEDSNGVERTINFTRPTIINIAIRITYTLYDEEEFPEEGEETMESIALEHSNGLGLNVDVIPKRFYGPIYDAVPGLDEVTVEVQQIDNPGDTPNGLLWQETKLGIDFDEISNTTVTDIYIVGP